MFKLLFQIILIVYIVLLFFNILDLKKYNKNGIVRDCETIEEVIEEIKNLNPIVFKHENDYDFKEFILDNGENMKRVILEEKENISIENEKSLLNQIDTEKIPNFYEGKIPMINNKSISIYKNTQTRVEQCHDLDIAFYVLHGSSKVFILNPKHKEDIKDKENKNIKKWAHIKILEKGDYLIIPTNWYYFFETSEECLMYKSKTNNIFTFVPNFIRDNYSSFRLPDFITSVI